MRLINSSANDGVARKTISKNNLLWNTARRLSTKADVLVGECVLDGGVLLSISLFERAFNISQ